MTLRIAKGVLFATLLAIIPQVNTSAQTQYTTPLKAVTKESKHHIRLHITDNSQQALMMASCQLLPLGIPTTTDLNSIATASAYNLNGYRVGTRATFEQLPSGIYIMNGKKIIK